MELAGSRHRRRHEIEEFAKVRVWIKPETDPNPLDRVRVFVFQIQTGSDRVRVWLKFSGSGLDITDIRTDPTRCHP